MEGPYYQNDEPRNCQDGCFRQSWVDADNASNRLGNEVYSIVLQGIQADWYEKKGRPWHVAAVISKNVENGELEASRYALLFRYIPRFLHTLNICHDKGGGGGGRDVSAFSVQGIYSQLLVN